MGFCCWPECEVRFHVERDPEGMVIAGLLMQGLAAPEDRMSASLNPRLSMLSLTVPLGAGRFRAYVSIHKDAREPTAAPLSGGQILALGRLSPPSLRTGIRGGAMRARS
jgi:hypothetical protein